MWFISLAVPDYTFYIIQGIFILPFFIFLPLFEDIKSCYPTSITILILWMYLVPLSSLLVQQVLILQQKQLIQLEDEMAAGLAIE